jgi:iron-sulfur cluster repair protein YtfE (RIC family)
MKEAIMRVREELMGEHQRVEVLLREMQAAVRRDDPRELCATWTKFEEALSAHMRFEEEALLPRFAEIDPSEATALRTEHDELRRQLAELGVCADLHTLRADVTDQLLEKLRAHAKREDGFLYAWADRHFPEIGERLGQRHRERRRQELSRLFDEARVRMHLFGMDAKDQLHELRTEAEKLAHASHVRYDKVIARLRDLLESVAAPPD